MTFLHVAFLGGALAVAVPIVLHLVMRQQPKHLEFPALRFIRLRQSANRRQMKFRHWLLLALRCLVIGLLALALARPSILATGMLGDQEAPVAAALVFDTNPRMQYRQQNKSRLEIAQETAQWLLPQLPAESDVAVVDSRSASAAFAVDLGAARQRIERLDAGTITQPLAAALESALKLVHENDKPRKEVYVFTDLTRATWSADAMRDLTRQLKENSGIGIYLIDVGIKDPSNFGLGEMHLSGQVLSKNSPLHLQADLLHSGAGGERSVELHLVDRDSAETSLRDQRQFTFRPGESQRTDFWLRGLAPGIHQGKLQLVGEDALSCDDVRWFTVEVRPPWKVLIAAPQDAARQPDDYALFLSQALAPDEFRIKGEAAFLCDVISTEELARKPLEGYTAVFVIDPRPLAPGIWQKLHSYVSAGGGLGIFLGRNAMPIDSFNEPLPQELLPGKLVRQWRAEPPNEVYLAPENLEHPLLTKFRALESSIAWESLPVFRHWQLGSLAKETGVVVPFSNGKPALLERPIGKGRVITMTTSISDPASGKDVWNLLPTGEGSWPFLMLINETTFYLVGSGQERLNYSAGETAVVHLGSVERSGIHSVLLTTPRGDQIRTPADERQSAVVVTSTEAAGNYRLQAGGPEQGVDLGFSVNLPPEVSQLDRVSIQDLKTVFGETQFHLARDRDEIDRSVSAVRVGQELYPYLIVLLAIILGCELALSNRFYQDYDTAVKRSDAALLAARTAAGKPEVRNIPVAP
ncbi:MAG: BatA domain-containing protein [Planctomycetia bacterium]|nr:BatA domain-containing protein [Planctomycetia bacterium]